jgi:hypothetical protein
MSYLHNNSAAPPKKAAVNRDLKRERERERVRVRKRERDLKREREREREERERREREKEGGDYMTRGGGEISELMASVHVRFLVKIN